MKMLTALMFLFTVSAHAGMAELSAPLNNRYVPCFGIGFNADHSVTAACRSVYSYPCSGRACQPVQMITNYVAAFDSTGAFVSLVACSVTRHHYPQTDTVTYTAGYDATTCLAPNVEGTMTTVTINGVPYYYVTTDVTGAELVNSNVTGFLYLP